MHGYILFSLLYMILNFCTHLKIKRMKFSPLLNVFMEKYMMNLFELRTPIIKGFTIM